jgi:hypothetical protein
MSTGAVWDSGCVSATVVVDLRSSATVVVGSGL